MARWSKKEEPKNEVSFEIIEELGVLSTNKETGWSVEVNVVSWNGGAPKVEVRPWAPEHKSCAKGIRLTDSEAELLGKILVKAFK